MQKIGEDISERLEFVPASLQVIEEVRPKYACAKGCGVAAAEKPAAPIEKGLAGAGSVGAGGRQQIWGSPSAEPHGVDFSAPRRGAVAEDHVRLDGRLCGVSQSGVGTHVRRWCCGLRNEKIREVTG